MSEGVSLSMQHPLVIPSSVTAHAKSAASKASLLSGSTNRFHDATSVHAGVELIPSGVLWPLRSRGRHAGGLGHDRRHKLRHDRSK
jgi:hypothetical protein